ncbi:MAG: ATP-binding protein [Bryobacteraceae bacterium]
MIVISIPIICILFCGIALYIFQGQRDELSHWIRRAFNAGSRIQAVVTLLVDAETGVRGFLVTQDVKYLEAYHKAESELGQRLARLREGFFDSPSQLGRLERVESLAKGRLATLKTILSQPKSANLPEWLSSDGALNASISAEFAAMRQEESNLWIARTAAETQLRNRLSTTTYVAAVLCIFAGALAMFLLLAGIVRRSQLLQQNADRLASGQPLVELTPAADEIGRLGEALVRSSRLLSERESELRRLNQDLDLRVKERTSELLQETTERKRSEDQLRQAQKMEAIGRLAGGVAHDFNNALTVIIGYGRMLRGTLPSGPDRENLEEVLRAADHASSLTRQLLAFSRRQVIQPKIVDLNSIVTRLDKFLRRLIGEDIEFRTLPGPGLEKVCVDEGQIEQVVMNLVVNARDAMPRGGKLTIQTDMVDLDDTYARGHLNCPAGRYVMLAVTDSGHGIPAEIQAKIFEPFFTTKEHGKGTGLGLSTVYGIIQQSGGTIWVYSEVGVGTTFKVYLPPAVGDVSSQPQPAARVLSSKDSGTILVVEDDPTVRRLTLQILTQTGYVVLEADGADSARRWCREHPNSIDLLLTDVIMPKTNGRELTQELQAMRPGLRAVYMSGYTDDAISHHAVLDSGVTFIEKPFTPERLCSVIREVIARGSEVRP